MKRNLPRAILCAALLVTAACEGPDSNANVSGLSQTDANDLNEAAEKLDEQQKTMPTAIE